MSSTAGSKFRFNRFLYLGTSLVFLALVFWTFARTFYLKQFFGSPPLSALLYVHGTVMTGWVVLLVAQTGLVATRRTRWHRLLGVFGVFWAALVVLLGSITTLHAAAREVREHTSFAASQITITSLDLLQMMFFAAFVALAVQLRHRPGDHKRLMLLTIACMLPDALGRLPVSFMTQATEAQHNLRIMLGLDMFVIIVVGFDTIWHRRLHPAFAWGALLFVGAFHVALDLTQTHEWIVFGESLFR
jgi:hypothetical protein